LNVATEIDEAIGGYGTDEVYLLPDYEKNSLAVLPFNFTANGEYNSILAGEATNYATNYLSQKSNNYNLNVEGINNTVKKLIDANLALDALNTAPAKKLIQIANTEYIVKANLIQTTAKSYREGDKSSLEGYFGKKIKENSQASSKNDGDYVDISLEVYNARDSKLIYSKRLSEHRKPLSEKQLSTIMPHWKSALTYLLNGFLSTLQ